MPKFGNAGESLVADTRANIEAAQLKKFRALARLAEARSPYYARIIRERGIQLDSCVPGDFPVLTKSLLMANFNDARAPRPSQRRRSARGKWLKNPWAAGVAVVHGARPHHRPISVPRSGTRRHR